MLRKVLVTLMTCGSIASPQSTARPRYMDRAIVFHKGFTATVMANAPIPLHQAISAIREEYGWRVNWEQAPCNSHFDLADDTAPDWRDAHPGQKGVTRPAGTSFTSSFPEVRRASEDEENTLTKIIEDYNATENPGKYILRREAQAPFTIVGTRVRDEDGTLREVSPLLDTRINLSRQTRTASDTVEQILLALSSATGKKIIIMSLPENILRSTEVTMGSDDAAPARQLLQQALDSTRRLIEYDLGYDPDGPVYILNVYLAGRAEDDGHGGTKIVLSR